MTDKEQQIKKTSEYLETVRKSRVEKTYTSPEEISRDIAEALYNAGYRDVSNGAVVLTAEENSEYLKLKANFENAKEVIDFLQTDNKRLSNSIAKYKDLVCKETAKAILTRIKNMYRETGCGIGHATLIYIKSLAKEYDVGID